MLNYPITPGMSWQDHYATHGFAVLPGLMDPAWVNAALAEACRIVGKGLPPEEWTTANVGALHERDAAINSPTFRAVYDDPNLRRVIDEMLGHNQWGGDRDFKLFVSPFNPEAKPQLPDRGHLDFVRCPIPIFGSGFMCQIALHKTETIGGNIALWPGSHKEVQRRLMENPERQFPQDFPMEPRPCFEFVADPGDVLLFSHLAYHEATPNHAAGRSPRINLHCQVNRAEWISRIDSASPNLCVWERSLAQNGPYTATRDEKTWCVEFRRRHSQQQRHRDAGMAMNPAYGAAPTAGR